MDVTIEAIARPNAKKELDWRVVVALALRSAQTPVIHGENAGETLDETAIARVLSEPVSMPARPGDLVRVRLTKPKDLEWSDLDVVVFVQAEEAPRLSPNDEGPHQPPQAEDKDGQNRYPVRSL